MLHDITYFLMLEEILENENSIQNNRTAVQTISTHGYMAKYELHGHYDIDNSLIIENFPLLTTKKLNFDAILCELLWFINGHTNIKLLEDNNVHIWADWPLKKYNQSNPDNQLSRSDFIKAIREHNSFASAWGELGPVYGSQWREWDSGETYSFYSKELGELLQVLKPENKRKIDQFKIMLDTVKNNPSSRRNIVTAWNPAEIEEMSISGLPPCHTLWQILVKDGKVNLMLHQRSLDSFLGAPYNIASYSLLLAMIAEYAGLLPGKFIHSIADCHLYVNHLDQVKEQMSRKPYDSPEVNIRSGFLSEFMQLPLRDNFNFQEWKEGVVLNFYDHHPFIKGDVAV